MGKLITGLLKKLSDIDIDTLQTDYKHIQSENVKLNTLLRETRQLMLVKEEKIETLKQKCEDLDKQKAELEKMKEEIFAEKENELKKKEEELNGKERELRLKENSFRETINSLEGALKKAEVQLVELQTEIAALKERKVHDMASADHPTDIEAKEDTNVSPDDMSKNTADIAQTIELPALSPTDEVPVLSDQTVVEAEENKETDNNGLDTEQDETHEETTELPSVNPPATQSDCSLESKAEATDETACVESNAASRAEQTGLHDAENKGADCEAHSLQDISDQKDDAQKEQSLPLPQTRDHIIPVSSSDMTVELKQEDGKLMDQTSPNAKEDRLSQQSVTGSKTGEDAVQEKIQNDTEETEGRPSAEMEAAPDLQSQHDELQGDTVTADETAESTEPETEETAKSIPDDTAENNDKAAATVNLENGSLNPNAESASETPTKISPSSPASGDEASSSKESATDQGKRKEQDDSPQELVHLDSLYLLKSKYPYIRVTLKTFSQCIYDSKDLELKIGLFDRGIEGKELILDKIHYIDENEVLGLEGLDDPFCTEELQCDFSTEDGSAKAAETLLTAICSCQPIYAMYNDKNGHITQRNMYYICFKPQVSKFKLPFKNMYTEIFSDSLDTENIVAMTQKFTEPRNFAVSQILTIRSFNAFVSTPEGIKTLEKGIKLAIDNDQKEMARLIKYEVLKKSPNIHFRNSKVNKL